MTFILGIIPARGGSKGIPNKNIANLREKPLLAHTIEAAKKSRLLHDFILSTDSEAIARCAAEYGLKSSSLRPPELSSDEANSVDVAIYEIQKYENEHNVCVDIVVLLQPTAPMRTSVDIDCALNIFLKSNTASLISVYEATTNHPNLMYYLHDDKLEPILEEGRRIKRRQEYKPVFVRNGALYIVNKEQLVDRKSFVCANPTAYIMSRERSVNIDDPFDLELAEWMMSRHPNESEYNR